MFGMQVIGAIDGSGRITLVDKQAPPDTPAPVDLDLDKVLGKMPNKTFTFNRARPQLQPLTLPPDATPQAALERVLQLPSVCSKRFLTTKVDRHVTGGPIVQLYSSSQQHFFQAVMHRLFSSVLLFK